jgi:hypothetical protein
LEKTADDLIEEVDEEDSDDGSSSDPSGDNLAMSDII